MWTLLNLAVSFAFAAPADVQARVDAALAERHEVSCATIMTLGARDQVRDALVVASKAELPPWSPMRAAGCLTEIAADPVARAEVERLVDLPGQPGFALVVSERLSKLPVAPALELARLVHRRSASDPRLQRLVAPHLAASVHEPVRALVASTTR